MQGAQLAQAKEALSWAARTYLVAALSAIASVLYYVLPDPRRTARLTRSRMNSPEKDFTHRSWLSTAAAALIAVLAAVSFIPPQSLGERQAAPGRHPLGCPRHVRRRGGGRTRRRSRSLFDEADFHVDLGAGGRTHRGRHRAARRAGHLSRGIIRAGQRSHGAAAPRPTPARLAATARSDRGLRHRGHAGACGPSATRCSTPGVRVRIAFLGDSFVEGDILTADLREQLQLASGSGPAAVRDSPRWPRR